MTMHPDILKSWSTRVLCLFTLIAAFGAVPTISLADHNPDQDCHPNQPGCTPDGEHYLYFTKPAKGLPYILAERAYLWETAWRRFDPNNPLSEDRYDPAYVHPEGFKASFTEQCQNLVDWDYQVNNIGNGANASTYRWSVNGVVQVASGDCFVQELWLPGQGIHDVKLEVFAPGASNPYLTKTEDVRVRDYLVVLFGDSAASGEGAPEFSRGPIQEWGTWIDRRCHRSSKAAVPLAVQMLEDADPHSTVTFLNFACSGATLSLWEEGQGIGILGPYAGIEKPGIILDLEEDGRPDLAAFYWLPAQVDQLLYALIESDFPVPDFIPDRPVDMLFTTGGINDVRFSALALTCVLLDNCDSQFTPFYDAEFNFVGSVFDDLADNIPAAYVALADALEARQIQVDETYVMQYPGAFENDDGTQCQYMLADVLPTASVWHLVFNPVVAPWVGLATLVSPLVSLGAGVSINDILSDALLGDLEWSADEIDWMVRIAMPRLDQAVRDGAAAAGFNFVDGIKDAFAGHGYCANDNWIQTARGSSDTQGPWNIVSKPLNIPLEPLFNPFADLGLDVHALTKGLMHPGSKGYEAAAQVLKPVILQLKNRAPIAKADAYNVNTAITPVLFDTGFGAGVLLNDFDPDGDPIRSVLVTGPKYGTATLSLDGRLIYTPNAGFSGTDSVYYKATDGGLESPTVKVTLLVGNPRDPKPTWKWTFPTGDQTPVVQIGGVAEFPICSRCGDLVIQFGPERVPGYGRVSFERKNDNWVMRYIQDGRVPPRLPWTETTPVEIGRVVLGRFTREGRADIPVRIEGEAQPQWSWIFRTPESVARNGTTRFDLCDSCGDLEVRLTATRPQLGSVTVELDAARGRWVATYIHNPLIDSTSTSDGFGLEIGNLNESGGFTVLDTTRVALALVVQ